MSRKSRRGQQIPELKTINIPESFPLAFKSDRHIIVSCKTIFTCLMKQGIQNIKIDQPFMLSFPVPTDRHAIVCVFETPKLLKISEWGGERDINKYIEDGDMNIDDFKRWENYYEILKILTDIFHYQIDYYPIEADLFKCAKSEAEAFKGSGGCSRYADEWIKRFLFEKEKLGKKIMKEENTKEEICLKNIEIKKSQIEKAENGRERSRAASKKSENNSLENLKKDLKDLKNELAILRDPQLKKEKEDLKREWDRKVEELQRTVKVSARGKVRGRSRSRSRSRGRSRSKSHDKTAKIETTFAVARGGKYTMRNKNLS
jgi:hypothetical protein